MPITFYMNRSMKLRPRFGPQLDALDSAAKEFLITALDPYHDTEYTQRGVPDVSTNASFNRQIRSRLSITKPVGIPPGTSWDLWVLSTGNATSPSTSVIGQQNYVDSGAVPTQINKRFSPLLAFPVVHGSSWNTAMAAGTVEPIILYAEDDPLRVTGLAFEIVNATAPLFKSGDITCFRSPSSYPETYVQRTHPAFPNDQNRMWKGQTIHPGSLAEAQALFGSVTWSAADGALCVGTQDYNLCKYSPNLTSGVVCPLVDPGGIAAYFPKNAAPNEMNATVNYNNVRPFGCVLAGLSDETTITITARMNVEVAPMPSSVDVFLATRPEEANQAVLALYADIAKCLPPGVPVSFNEKGDWFKIIKAIAIESLPTIPRLLLNAGDYVLNEYNRRSAAASALPTQGKVQPATDLVKLASSKPTAMPKVQARARFLKKGFKLSKA